MQKSVGVGVDETRVLDCMISTRKSNNEVRHGVHGTLQVTNANNAQQYSFSMRMGSGGQSLIGEMLRDEFIIVSHWNMLDMLLNAVACNVSTTFHTKHNR